MRDTRAKLKKGHRLAFNSTTDDRSVISFQIQNKHTSYKTVIIVTAWEGGL